ncbi:MAG: hypothetical protein ACE5G9_12755 [Nitrospinales bacterium]
MNRLKKLVSRASLSAVFVWGVVFFLHATASAHPVHSHPQTLSPFDGVKTHAHCLLNQHHTGVLVCPHTNKPLFGSLFQIASECGGSPDGKTSAKFGFNHNPNLVECFHSLAQTLTSFPYFFSTAFDPSFLPDSLDHPPKFL